MYVKTPVNVVSAQDQGPLASLSEMFQTPSKPTPFTNLIGNELFYGESVDNVNTNREWQEMDRSAQDITSMFDRLVEGAEIVDSGQSGDEQSQSFGKKQSYSVAFTVLILILAFVTFGYLLFGEPHHMIRNLVIILIAVSLAFLQR